MVKNISNLYRLIELNLLGEATEAHKEAEMISEPGAGPFTDTVSFKCFEFSLVNIFHHLQLPVFI